MRVPFILVPTTPYFCAILKSLFLNLEILPYLSTPLFILLIFVIYRITWFWDSFIASLSKSPLLATFVFIYSFVFQFNYLYFVWSHWPFKTTILLNSLADTSVPLETHDLPSVILVFYMFFFLCVCFNLRFIHMVKWVSLLPLLGRLS